MRRLTSLIGITLLALLVSGGGNLFATTFCPHAAGGWQVEMTESRNACHASAPAAHHQESNPNPMDGMEMAPVAERSDNSRAVPAGQLTGTCSHCVGQSKAPFTVAVPRELSLKKRDAVTPLQETATPTALPATSFSRKFIARQNAPPGASNRKYLLLGTFLI